MVWVQTQMLMQLQQCESGCLTLKPSHLCTLPGRCCRYLPQGEKVQAVHRFLWQVQYLVSQGFYVVLTHTSYLTRDPNMVDPNMLASNWGNLWRMITELPAYRRHLRGRVFAGGSGFGGVCACVWRGGGVQVGLGLVECVRGRVCECRGGGGLMQTWAMQQLLEAC